MRRINHKQFLIVFFLLCTWTVFAGISASQGQKIFPKRPGVYITFHGFVRSSVTNQRQARLVLHNNTRWAIHYGEWLERVLPGDVAIIYTVELDNGCIGGRTHTSVVTTGKLLPGKSVSFSVPFEDLPKRAAIFVEFDFSWELVRGERVRDEAVHRTYFLFSDLPPWPDAESP